MDLHEKHFSSVAPEYQEEFSKTKFIHNNMCVMFLSLFLIFEQIYYGLYVAGIGTDVQKAHYYTAFAMFIYLFASIYIHLNKPKKIIVLHKLYEISFGVIGFAIAIYRALFIGAGLFYLPTIYIAVIYGFSVVFYFKPIKTFLIYSLTSIFLIVELPQFQVEITQNAYAQDIISNNLIGWIVSIINYRRYVKDFENKKVIHENHKELQEKNIRIEKMNERLKEISNKDTLTQLYNRRKLDEVLNEQYELAQNLSSDFSVILVDLDSFKQVNDTYGHNIGDKVLVETAQILENNIRDFDFLGRWGGEEFLIVCPGTDIESALDISNNLKNAIESYEFSIPDRRTSSFGVATYKNGDKIEDLIGRADQGLYKAKENGKNSVFVAG